MDIKADSIQKRFAVSLIINIMRSIVSFVTVMLVARWLGPNDYGRMAFLLASFVAFKQLIDMSTSAAFFTFLSQRKRSNYFVRYFAYWVGVQFSISLVLIAFILPESIAQIIWKDEQRALIVMAMVAVFMQHHVWVITSQMAEASRQTIQVQKLNIVVISLHFIVLMLLWLIGKLTIPLIFVALILEWSIASRVAFKMYKQEKLSNSDYIADTPMSVFKEFWHYCLPFVPYAWLGFVHDLADRWMLQNWGGSKEQAYYAVALQFSSLVLLVTASILRILWKEIAEAHHQGNSSRVYKLYLKASRGLFFVGAVTAGGLIPWSSEIITVFLGDIYLDGTITLMIMLLYPVHQAIGQIGGSILYATEKSKVQVLLGLSFMFVSIIAAYFILAPKTLSIPGLGLASQGLAIKMVLLQLVGVNIQSYFIAKILGWRYDWLFQIVGLISTVAAGYAAKFLSLIITNILSLQVVISTLMYLILVILILILMPWLSGLNRNDILFFKRKVIGLFY